jgi:hypothetical protein
MLVTGENIELCLQEGRGKRGIGDIGSVHRGLLSQGLRAVAQDFFPTHVDRMPAVAIGK